MPIVDITPVGSKSYDPQKKVVPVYLVVIEDVTVKVTGTRKFLAVKLDDMPNYVKIVGIEITTNVNKISESYQEIVNSTDKKLYKEVMLPWQRIVTIQNLIFKQK